MDTGVAASSSQVTDSTSAGTRPSSSPGPFRRWTPTSIPWCPPGRSGDGPQDRPGQVVAFDADQHVDSMRSRVAPARPRRIGLRPGREPEGWGAVTVGKARRNRAPPPGAWCTLTCPPSSSATWATMASPRPDPGRLRASGAR